MADKKTENQPATPEGEGQMPLFYKDPRPLDSQAHKDLYLRKDLTFAFTKEINAVPINLVEFPQIAQFYPIAFGPDEQATPVAILGLRDKENLYLDANGHWLRNTYVPAYIRRYPFIFSEVPDGDRLALCIDMDERAVTTDSKNGVALFNDKGEPTEVTNNAMEFCKSYHAAAEQTLEFGKALHESGILIDRQAEIPVTEEQKIRFGGFRVIDEEKLNNLDDKTFLQWRKNQWLPYVYAHLLSSAHWQSLGQLLRMRLNQEAA